jgi:uncharacterized protein YxeA
MYKVLTMVAGDYWYTQQYGRKLVITQRGTEAVFNSFQSAEYARSQAIEAYKSEGKVKRLRYTILLVTINNNSFSLN